MSFSSLEIPCRNSELATWLHCIAWLHVAVLFSVSSSRSCSIDENIGAPDVDLEPDPVADTPDTLLVANGVAMDGWWMILSGSGQRWIALHVTNHFDWR